MRRYQGKSGFTLIEMMIVIAILSIICGTQWSARNTFESLRREEDYRFALRNARHQWDALRARSFDELPPRVLTVPGTGIIQAGQTDLVEGSIKIYSSDGYPVNLPVTVDHESGRIVVSPSLKGKRIILDYRFMMPDTGEAHTAPSGEPCGIRLANSPVIRVLRVFAASGNNLTPLSEESYKLQPETGFLSLPKSASGHVITVDYIGGSVQNIVSGRFLRADLKSFEDKEKPGAENLKNKESGSPPDKIGIGPVKLIKIEEKYGGNAMKMDLSFIKGEK